MLHWAGCKMNPKDEVLEIRIKLPCYKGWDKEGAEQLFSRVVKYIRKLWVRSYVSYRFRKPNKSEMKSA